jgi:hypothetical protein
MELRIVFWLFVLGLLISVLFSVPANAADKSATVEGILVTITDDKCANGKVLRLVDMYSVMDARVAGKYFAGHGKSKNWEGDFCYKFLDDKRIFIVDEDGGFGNMKLAPFLKGTI